MLTSLRLTNFKNFQDTELTLGPLTILVGTNASGKSNIRDAFRFLHGISRGYTLAEILGEKWVEGGVLQWRGIRGGTREATFLGGETFALEVTVANSKGINAEDSEYRYRIEVAPGLNEKPPRIINESLHIHSAMHVVIMFRTDQPLAKEREIQVSYLSDPNKRLPMFKDHNYSSLQLNCFQPLLAQFAERSESYNNYNSQLTTVIRETKEALNYMRFLDLNPDAMRQPSLPGQTVLGDRGENLSSVLQAICQTKEGKETLLSWLQELTPMDAVDFEFNSDLQGRVTLIIKEKNGQLTSAYSASDGTLRFLAMIAALLGPEAAHFYFFEELDNGIHPTRLALLLQLIEQRVSEGHIQMVATTHSPPLLRLLSAESLESASLVYRAAEKPEASVIRILDLPDARRILHEQDAARLLESGWLEDAVAFNDTEAEAEKQAA